MIELLFVACLISSPEVCEDRSMLYDAHDVSLMVCITQGQHELARWASENPKWSVGKHTCHILDGELDA